MFSSSYTHSFGERKYTAVQQVFYRVLLPGFVHNSM